MGIFGRPKVMELRNTGLPQSGGLPEPINSETDTYVAPFSGSGTSADPYLISNASELNQIGSNPRLMNSYFLVTSNIDLTAFSSYEPIGRRGGFFWRI